MNCKECGTPTINYPYLAFDLRPESKMERCPKCGIQLVTTVGYMHPKPPYGVMSQKIWLEDRCRELSGAIERKQLYCMQNSYTAKDFQILHKWSVEFEEHTEKLKTVEF